MASPCRLRLWRLNSRCETRTVLDLLRSTLISSRTLLDVDLQHQAQMCDELDMMEDEG